MFKNGLENTSPHKPMRRPFNQTEKSVFIKHFRKQNPSSKISDEDLLSQINNDYSVLYFHKNNRTTAIIFYDKKVIEADSAKRNPRDKNNPELGELIAFGRCLK
jgi:hypothetical protein